MKMELVKVTPIMACNMLGNNINNRNISKRRVATYAQHIKNGDWQINGEAIKLTKDGTLLDGQHRLHAIIQADKAVETYVLSGVASEVFKTIDTGKGRGASDILSIAGFENTTSLAAAVRIYQSIEDNWKFIENAGRSRGLTNIDILNFVQNTKGFDKAVAEALQYKKFCKLITGSLAGALYYVFSQKSKAGCAQFFHEVDTGEGLVNNKPAYMLREALIDIKGYKEMDIRKVRWLAISHAITAWNAFREKKQIDKLPILRKFDGYPEVL
jgi:hypothetical protein